MARWLQKAIDWCPVTYVLSKTPFPLGHLTGWFFNTEKVGDRYKNNKNYSG